MQRASTGLEARKLWPTGWDRISRQGLGHPTRIQRAARDSLLIEGRLQTVDCKASLQGPLLGDRLFDQGNRVSKEQACPSGAEDLKKDHRLDSWSQARCCGVAREPICVTSGPDAVRPRKLKYQLALNERQAWLAVIPWGWFLTTVIIFREWPALNQGPDHLFISWPQEV